MLVAQWGRKGTVEQLLASQADTSLRNRKREQAVTLATTAGHEEIAKLLAAQNDSEFWLLKGF